MGLRAEELREELRPLVDGEKSLLLKIIPGHRPEVTFIGTWSGKYIKAAIDSIAKAYRVARRNITTPRVQNVGIITPQNAVEQGGKNGR